jgi:hypothetical protein
MRDDYNIIRQDLRAGKQFVSLQQTLLTVDEIYPHVAPVEQYVESLDSDISFDNIEGDTYRGFQKNLTKFIRKLNNLLSDDTKVVVDKARFSASFKSKVKGENKLTTYYPLIIQFKDGQTLVGLARQYGENKDSASLNRDEPIKVTRWVLNDVDINKAIFTDKKVLTDNALQAKKIAGIIKANHVKFVKANPEIKTVDTKELEANIQSVKDEIKALEAELSTVVKAKEVKAENDKKIADEKQLKKDEMQKLSKELTLELQKENESLQVVVNEDFTAFDIVETNDDTKLVKSGDEQEIREFIAEAKNINENKEQDTDEDIVEKSTQLLEKLKGNETYKQILKDSHGGVTFDNSKEYDGMEELLAIWTRVEFKDVADGTVKSILGWVEDKVKEIETGNDDNDDFSSKLEDIYNLETYEDMKNAYNSVLDELGDREDEFGEILDKIDERLTEKLKSENE